MSHRIRTLLVLFVMAGIVAAPHHAGAVGLGDLKKKAKKAADDAKKAVGTPKAEESKEPAEEAAPAAGGEGEADAGATPAGKAAGGSATSEDMALYTKYDFIPGDKVLFYDDLAREEMGEFPSRWNLDHGVFEIAKKEGQNWILCTNRGIISPKVPLGPLPDKYTVELEFYMAPEHTGWLYINWVDTNGDRVGTLAMGYGTMTYLETPEKRLANKDIDPLTPGKHVMRIMATKTTIKCYIDQERIANVPKMEGFAPAGFTVEVNPYFDENRLAMIGSYRYAEGGKTMRQQLDEDGKIVTHGILFDSGSDKIKAESYKTLADIGGLMTDSPGLRISIEGHTDSDGADAANMTLSQKRADSVKAWLVTNYKIAGDRMETKGWGESQPIDGNDTAEGKANNRRVELVKL